MSGNGLFDNVTSPVTCLALTEAFTTLWMLGLRLILFLVEILFVYFIHRVFWALNLFFCSKLQDLLKWHSGNSLSSNVTGSLKPCYRFLIDTFFSLCMYSVFIFGILGPQIIFYFFQILLSITEN